MEKRRCGTCIYLNKIKKKGVLCSELGKNKGCPPCKNWEPDIESLSSNVRSIISLMGDCELDDIPILEWLLKKQHFLLKNNSALRIGRTVWLWLDRDCSIYKVSIQGVTSKYVIGKSEEGITFFLTLDTRVYSSREELLEARKVLSKVESSPEKDTNGVGLMLGRVKDGIIQRSE